MVWACGGVAQASELRARGQGPRYRSFDHALQACTEREVVPKFRGPLQVPNVSVVVGGGATRHNFNSDLQVGDDVRDHVNNLCARDQQHPEVSHAMRGSLEAFWQAILKRNDRLTVHAMLTAVGWDHELQAPLPPPPSSLPPSPPSPGAFASPPGSPSGHGGGGQSPGVGGAVTPAEVLAASVAQLQAHAQEQAPLQMQAKL